MSFFDAASMFSQYMYDASDYLARMTTQPIMNPEDKHFNFIRFNSDSKSLVIGHSKGYAIYDMDKVLNDDSILTNEFNSLPDTFIVERLHNSSLLAVVSRKDPRVIIIYHFINRQIIKDLKYSSSVLNVRMNRDRLIVCLEDVIHIHNLVDMKAIHTISDVPRNKNGIIDFTNRNISLIAYPGSDHDGQVNIFDANSLQSVNSFLAHENLLSALRFNPEGSMIATASTRGTVIRVFNVSTGTKVFEFQRGVRCAEIHSLSFSSNSSLLSSSSNFGTLHVYKLTKAEETTSEYDGWGKYLQDTAKAYLPVQGFMREKDFAEAYLSPSSGRTIAAIVKVNGKDHVVSASTDGILNCFSIPEEGGVCELLKTHTLENGSAREMTPERKEEMSPKKEVPLITHDGTNVPLNYDRDSQFHSILPK